MERAKREKSFGIRFSQTKGFENYIVDFYCNELMLAIEIDGSSHNDNTDYDIRRQKELENEGVHFLRYHDVAIRKNVKEIVQDIVSWIKENEVEHTPSG